MMRDLKISARIPHQSMIGSEVSIIASFPPGEAVGTHPRVSECHSHDYKSTPRRFCLGVRVCQKPSVIATR